MIGRCILLSAFPSMLLNGVPIPATVLSGIVTFAVLAVMDSGRGIRTLPSTIMSRFMCAIWAVLFSMFYLLGNTAAGRAYFSFADTVICSFWITVIITLLFWMVTRIGSRLVMNDPDYRRWVAAGGHHLWDTLPTVLNPDSDLIRNGGSAEPVYTDFVPPPHWRHQCPKCNSRVQHAVDICWACQYGADGDSTAYFDRYGKEHDSN